MQGKLKPEFKKLRMYEGILQREVGAKIGVVAGVVYNQENNLDGTRFSRVIEMFDAIGYDLYVEKRKEEEK